MKLQTYAAFSFLATVAAVYHAFSSRGQFYPAMVHLSTSKICFVLLLNMGLVMMCITWQLVKSLFLGSLREAEVERLNEQSWREVMEILFAITIFRQDFSVMFLAMVTALLLIKALHWLAQKRVEYIETTPAVPKLSHIRIVAFMGFLLLVDCLFLYSSIKSLIQTWEASVFLFFAFEYTILATTTVSTFVKYVFYVSDMLMEGQWERKAVYTFYLELVRDLLHLSIYIVFFLVIFASYGVPLHLIRELYETFRSFRMRVADYIRYRKITSNMNERFPDASPEELNASDATCIICREEMITAKKLRCGHLFHVHCLRSWLERQHTCPTCRSLVAPPESGSTAIGQQQAVPSDNQPGPAAAGTTQASDAGAVNQNQSLLQAAAMAAKAYEKSFVHFPTNHYTCPPGYTVIPQIPNIQASNGGIKDQNGTNISGQFLKNQPISSQHNLTPFQVPVSSTDLREAALGNPNLQGSPLKVEKLIQSQIELLRAQLQALEQLMAEQSKARSAASSSSRVLASSDCGCHGEAEDADTD
ncbi:ERAD-associated E3 ubiquitin-protein ligase HRD1 isoform X2 [Phalaenopsis equestris]|uniref:ERAD-associated E3 ubiquitin-protein ligase HRD1 isoform X2 n=1 Tax=Phalaenopsis equestris TaxID=78828 RepID=UPI0009E585B7|nr:ERAD-associated E3 ubiquitin-protein ligase HRD1 isoform X2 [Phalaenopsis equestris]